MVHRVLVAPGRKYVTAAAVHPNAGVEAAYHKRMDALIARMAAGVLRRLSAIWRTNPPELTEDASPAAELREAMERMRRDWQAQFDDLADTAGRRFADEATSTADRSFAAKLKKAGFTVRFQRTRAINDVIQASVSENVQLIKSIPQQYLTQVESIVTVGVQTGRDMGYIAKALQDQLGVTRRRATIIARDQAGKSTAAIVRARQQEVGITQAVWLHSLGGRKPRRTHVAMNGKIYDIVKGMWDEDEKAWVLPGQLINCRCVSLSIIPGLD